MAKQGSSHSSAGVNLGLTQKNLFYFSIDTSYAISLEGVSQCLHFLPYKMMCKVGVGWRASGVTCDPMWEMGEKWEEGGR